MNEIAKTDNSTFNTILRAASSAIKLVAAKHISPAKLVALAIEAKQRNALLADCSDVSVINFCKKCAEWGTDRVGAGGVWAVPYYNGKTKRYDMQPIPDWRLLIERAKKSGAITFLSTDSVYENDDFSYERGTSPSIKHVPKLGQRGKLTHVYARWTLPDGHNDFLVMGFEQYIIPIRNRSKAWQNFEKSGAPCPWGTDEEQMAIKTVVKRALKQFEGATPELTDMIEADNVVNGFDDIKSVNFEPLIEPRALSESVNEPMPMESDSPTETKQVAELASNPKPAVFVGFSRSSGVQKSTGKFWEMFIVNAIDENDADLKLQTFSKTLGQKISTIKPESKVMISYHPGTRAGTLELDSIDSI